ncbi:MAG: aminopeptidase P family protein [Syntrophaceticus schinkii]|jgi:Xaa-Pro aminopeptidase|nr:aminopeptidase P family protein [Syntrophaceticus schinkii]MDD4261149.1 aminopeptidase P family protein [Syntrophaceticus schinkii]MDD4674920.1 aminopeptidase P family protein [Syntrophaceticus schinkii]
MDAYEQRRSKMYDLVNESGFSKAIIGDPNSIAYFTGIGITPYERFYAMVLDAKNRTSSMIIPSVDTNCMKGTLPEIVYLDSEGPDKVIADAVEGCEAIAIEKGYFNIAVGEKFQKLGCEMFDVGEAIAKLRMYKDELEIETIQTAAEIVDSTIEYLSKLVKPGMTEKELSLLMYEYMIKNPGVITDRFIILVLGGENSANIHAVPSDYAFKEGDIILLDFCAYYKNYWSDITRCLFLGEVGNDKLAEIYEIVLGANLAAIEKVKPGVKAWEVDKAARDYITNAGYGEQFLHRTGHGLGLDIHEEPFISASNDITLTEGMVFTIEPGIYLPGIGGVRIEDDVLVTKEGHRVLTKTSKKLEDHIIKCSK